jgi:hypothetical protein
VVAANSNNGAEGFNTNRFFCVVDLPSTWRLSEHKDLLINRDDEKELFEATRTTCLPLLEKATTAATMLYNTALTSAIELSIGKALGIDQDAPLTEKAKRGNGTKKGTATPTGNGPIHQDAAKRKPGRRMKARRIRGIRLYWGKASEDRRIVGRGFVSLAGTTLTVTLNEEHPPLAAASDSSNQDVIKAAAYSLVAAWQAETHVQGELPFASEIPSGVCAQFSYFAAKLDEGELLTAND